MSIRTPKTSFWMSFSWTGLYWCWISLVYRRTVKMCGLPTVDYTKVLIRHKPAHKYYIAPFLISSFTRASLAHAFLKPQQITDPFGTSGCLIMETFQSVWFITMYSVIRNERCRQKLAEEQLFTDCFIDSRQYSLTLYCFPDTFLVGQFL